MQIGFIGLGRMGSGMAENLLAAGHEVTVYNRTRAKSEALAAKGAKIAEKPAGACKGDAVMTMLANDDAVEHVVTASGGIIDELAKGALHISCSTISVSLSRHLAGEHAKAGQRYIAATVFGRPDAAAAGKLFAVAAGAAQDIATAEPVLAAIAQRTFVVGEKPEASNLVKLSGNFLIANVIEALGEAMALVSKGGIDKQTYLELLTSTLFGAPVYKTYGTLIADEKFSPAGFAAPLGLKDIRLVLEAGDELRVPLPIASLLRDRFLTLIANGGAELDWSAVSSLAAKDAGSAQN
jgi:3-hydroxyisobutyrate dehydrogenase-like beta-hydroxyacid dehydrogenase